MYFWISWLIYLIVFSLSCTLLKNPDADRKFPDEEYKSLCQKGWPFFITSLTTHLFGSGKLNTTMIMVNVDCFAKDMFLGPMFLWPNEYERHGPGSVHSPVLSCSLINRKLNSIISRTLIFFQLVIRVKT